MSRFTNHYAIIICFGNNFELYVIVILYSYRVYPIIPEYEYYRSYDEDALGDVHLEGQIPDFLLNQ